MSVLARNRVEVMHGVNLDQLGRRDPLHYGSLTLAELERGISLQAEARGLTTRFFQSNHEGAIVDELHRLRKWADAIVINPAAFTHYSYSIRDALLAVALPAAEVHLSDVDNREGDFRKISVVRDVCVHRFTGAGIGSYLKALDAFAADRAAKKKRR